MEAMAVCLCEELLQHSEETVLLMKQFPRTWRANEPRRHWEMMLHCERAIFPRPTPDLSLPTREARFYWHLYSAIAKHCSNIAILMELFNAMHRKKLSMDIIISEQLFRLKSFDALNRKTLIDRLEKYICQQSAIASLCIEGLELKRKEGLRLTLALFQSCKTVKSLYCWRAFKRKEGPLLVDTGNFTGSGLYTDRISRKCDWFRAIGCLEALTTLSLNYAYLATSDGDLLIALSKKIGKHWHWLQLLCLEEETPKIVNPNDGVGGQAIPDIAWREARLWAPCLKVQFVFIGIPEYDKHKRFITRHIPVHTFMLTTDIDFRFRQPWFLDCTIKTLWMWYPKTLVYLYLQLWHHREILDNQLRKLFPTLPKLKVFEFVGEIRDMKTLTTMCCQIRDQECVVNHLNIQLQDTIGIHMDRVIWTRHVERLIRCFSQAFIELGVKFEISFYPC